jgi:hypothetical protein
MSNVAPSAESNLQGRTFTFSTPEERNETLVQAFDYRGDVTLNFADGVPIEGYLFHADETRVKLYLKGNDLPQEFPSPKLTGITFTGKDTADGRSFDNWKAKKAGQRQVEIEAHEADMRAKGYL